MGYPSSQQTRALLGQRTWSSSWLHLWRDETTLRCRCLILPIHRHRSWWHGNAHAQTSLRILDCHSRTSQDWCRSHPSHPLAHPQGYWISLQCCWHLCYHLHGRARDARQNKCSHPPMPYREAPRRHWCSRGWLARLPSWFARSCSFYATFCTRQ